jgi:Asp-tRNA(Asn)/Glu-tRNA(Gln) amidotransferase A subunit family amidase
MSVPTGTLNLLSRAVRERRCSATALVTASIERLERAGALNVLADTSFDDALVALPS